MKFTPGQGMVLVEMEIIKGHWDEGKLIHRPDIGEEMPIEGVVRAVGRPSVTRKGATIDPIVKPGDRVMVPWATGTELHIGGVYHRAIRQEDILAVTNT